MKFSEADQKYLKEVLYLDNSLQLFLQNLFEKRRIEVEMLSLDANNWGIKRAYKDGQLAELNSLEKLLKPKESKHDRSSRNF